MTCANCSNPVRPGRRYCSRTCAAVALNRSPDQRARASAAMKARMASAAFRNELVLRRIGYCPLDLRGVRNKARKHFGAKQANRMIAAHLAAEKRRAQA